MVPRNVLALRGLQGSDPSSLVSHTPTQLPHSTSSGSPDPPTGPDDPVPGLVSGFWAPSLTSPQPWAWPQTPSRSWVVHLPSCPLPTLAAALPLAAFPGMGDLASARGL